MFSYFFLVPSIHTGEQQEFEDYFSMEDI
jgi:hypothetical protein